MYHVLLTTHSLLRWLVLITLIVAICLAADGTVKNKTFSKAANAFRHWTATCAHIQLMIGIFLYSQSPLVKYFWNREEHKVSDSTFSFYGVIHLSLMLLAIIILTTGSALAKRKQADRDKFTTMLTWFSASLIIILVAIPWPFSPLSARPLFRIY